MSLFTDAELIAGTGTASRAESTADRASDIVTKMRKPRSSHESVPTSHSTSQEPYIILRELSRHLQQMDELVGKLTFSLREIGLIWNPRASSGISTRICKSAKLLLLSRLQPSRFRLHMRPKNS